MAKKKGKYLPLYWTEILENQLRDTFPEITVEDLRIISEHGTSEMVRNKTILKYPRLCNLLASLMDRAERNSEYQTALKETVRDLDSMSLVMLWAKNKQVFAFDKDFTDELLRTEEVHLTKNGWDYLPFKTFYVDLSDNEELCDKILGKGLFITLEKLSDEQGEVYCVHVCKVGERYFYNDVFSFVNEDKALPVAEMMVDDKVLHFDHEHGMSHKAIDGKAYEVIVAQILTYLSSVEPDIGENPETQKTYRKPAPESKPKNKYSEIRKWDVGVRFGSAVRAWKKKNASGTTHTGGSGNKKRPHSRKAHWSHYWYGSGENKVRRPKWISECYVGMKDDDTPAVIHKVTKG